MNGKSLARLAAVIFVADAVTATAVEMTRKEDKPDGSAALQAPPSSVPNPLRDGLHRCQVLAEAALRDGACLRLWAEQRDRFLGFKAPEAAASRVPGAASHEER